MRVSIYSVNNKSEYENVRSLTFGDCSRLILPDHVDFSEVIPSGKIHILLSDNSIITLFNGSGIITLDQNFIKIACPKIFLSKQDLNKVKVDIKLSLLYNELAQDESS